jgi:hypothetical protein
MAWKWYRIEGVVDANVQVLLKRSQKRRGMTCRKLAGKNRAERAVGEMYKFEEL